MRTSDGSSSPVPDASSAAPGSDHLPNRLDLSSLPPTYILSLRLSLSELHELEDRLVERGLPLTYDVSEARYFVGRVGTKRRAELELRCRGLWTEQGDVQPTQSEAEGNNADDREPPQKRRRRGYTQAKAEPDEAERRQETIQVMTLQWLEESMKSGTLLPPEEYVVYLGHRIPRPPGASTPEKPQQTQVPSQEAVRPTRKSPTLKRGAFNSILERARADAGSSTSQDQSSQRRRPTDSRVINGRRITRPYNTHDAGQSQPQPPRLLPQTTSEHDEDANVMLPEMPEWVKARKKYSCERPTPGNSPNSAFIEKLKEIKLARLLTGDEIGVRAYSTSIAALAAYPATLSSTREILALPGCDAKIARLFQEWNTSGGEIEVVSDILNNKDMQGLRLFYEIWGVGAKTAREYYYEKGWRDLDDIVEHGWSSLSRVQQIGVKFYEEFQQKIPRAEVKAISNVITEHARRITNDGTIEACIVGGYRRGKAASGDVDIVLSHRDESQTLGLVQEIVLSLEKQGWITHTLQLSLTGSKRNQQPLPYRAGGDGGQGFDTLDKALVVWQDTDWPTKEPDIATAGADEKVKNPNIHRRVDIIIAPWRTVGCAIAGWSGGTTFQRDLRRYAKNVRGWKFDSSGVRDRSTGKVVDLEGFGGSAETWEEAERKVFEGMGLAYLDPHDRCTG